MTYAELEMQKPMNLFNAINNIVFRRERTSLLQLFILEGKYPVSPAVWNYEENIGTLFYEERNVPEFLVLYESL